MMRDLIAAILVAILVDVSWNAAGMRDPLPERAPITETGPARTPRATSAVSDTADAIRRGSKPAYNMALPSQSGTAGAVLQATTTGITWIVSGPDPSKLYCLTVDGADNVVNAGGACAAAR